MVKKRGLTKIVTAFVCGLLIFLVTGCGADSSSQNSNGGSGSIVLDNGDPTKLRRLVPEGQTATLKVWRPTHTAIGTLMESFSDTLFNKWMEEQTGVKIEWIIPVSGTEADNLAMLISSQEYPDIFFDAGLVYPTGAYGLMKDGVVIDVAQYLDKLPNYRAELERSDIRKKESYSDTGEMAAFYRFMMNDEPNSTDYGLLIRKDMLDKVGKSIPETYDEWYEVLKEFKKAGLERPYLLNSTGFPKLNMFTGGLGFGYMNYGGSTQPFYQVDGKVRYAPLEEGFKTYLQMMNKWYEEGLIDQDFLSLNSISAELTLYFDPNSGSYAAPLSLADVARQIAPDPSMEFVSAPHPVVNKGDKIHIGPPASPVFAGAQISSKTDKLDLALQWLDLYYSPDVILASNFGPDPSYYEQRADGSYAFNDKVFNNPDGFAPVDMMMYVADYPMVNYKDRSIGNEQLLGWVEENNKINDNAYLISSSLTLSDEENKVYASIMPGIIDYVEEMQVKYIMGLESFDGYDAFVQKIYDMGIEEVISVYQKALDRYNSR